MSVDINALMGVGLDTPAQQQMLAESLRGQQRAGDFLSLSTIKPIAQMGQNINQSAALSGKAVGSLNAARAKVEAEKNAANKLAKAKLLAEQTADKHLTDENKIKADAKAGERERVTYHNPTYTPENGEPETVSYFESPKGLSYEHTGENARLVDVTGLKPYDTGATASTRPITTAALKHAEGKAASKLNSQILQNNVITTLTEGDMGTFLSATGNAFDPVKFAGTKLPLMEEVEQFNSRLNSITVKGVLQDLEKMGSNPSEGERKFLLQGFPTDEKSPAVWLDWLEQRALPLYASRIGVSANKEAGGGEAGKKAEAQAIAEFEASLLAKIDGARRRLATANKESPVEKAREFLSGFGLADTTEVPQAIERPQEQQTRTITQEQMSRLGITPEVARQKGWSIAP